MKILVCGSRFWTNVESIFQCLSKFSDDTIIIHGACEGADEIAGRVALSLEFEIRTYPAKWKKYNRKAGPIRNRRMLQNEHLKDSPIDLVIAFHSDIDSSRGTKDMLKISQIQNIKTILVTE